MTQCHNVMRPKKPMMIEAFDELSKIVFAKIFDEIQVDDEKKLSHEFEAARGVLMEDTVRKIHAMFAQANDMFPEIFKDSDTKIDLRPQVIFKIVQILQQYSLLDTSLDIKGASYEAFLKSALPVGKSIGQFFTPREIVDLVVDMMEVDRQSSIIDPASGTGGFLVAAMTKVWQQIDQHYTQRYLDSPQHEKKRFASNNLLGIDIDPRMVRLARMNIIMHGNKVIIKAEHKGRVFEHDGLSWSERIRQIQNERFGMVLTNPPFGGRESDMEILTNFELASGKKSESVPALFLERSLQLLKPSGTMAIILPDPILSNARYVNLITKKSIIVGVIKLPPETFVPYGSTAETSVLIVKKLASGMVQKSVFIAQSDLVGYDKSGETVGKNDLEDLLRCWKDFESDPSPRILSEKPLAKIIGPDNLHKTRLDVRTYYHPNLDRVKEIISKSKCRFEMIGQVVQFRRITVRASKDPDREFRYIGLGNLEANTGRLVYKRYSGSQRSRMRIFHDSMKGGDITGSSISFEGGDVLYGKLRPNLRKAFAVPVEEGGICSTEFLVLTPNAGIDPIYLSYILRSDLVYDQLSHQVTGLGRPRVSKDMLARVKIPIDRAFQDAIVEGLKKIDIETEEKRNKAKKLQEEISESLNLKNSRISSLLLNGLDR